jgi:uncharacterized damage-inducible protein DinB
MNTESSITLLAELEQHVEQHLQMAIGTFQNLTDAELAQPSSTGGWSIAQCLWHLNSYGHYYLPQIKSGLTKNYAANASFKSTWLGKYFTNMMKPGPKMKKYNAFKNHVPPKETDGHKVVAEFILQQEEMLSLLKSARNNDLNRIKIPISIMKWLTLRLGDVFQFIIAHNERHLQQAARNLKNGAV